MKTKKTSEFDNVRFCISCGSTIFMKNKTKFNEPFFQCQCGARFLLLTDKDFEQEKKKPFNDDG